MITHVDDSSVPINIEDGRYMVFTQVTSPEGSVLANNINVVDVVDMTEYDNMIETIKTANNFYDTMYGCYVTGIVKIREQ